MKIAVIGVNHNNTPIEIREKVSFITRNKVDAVNYFLDNEIEEVIPLSTCNRSEIYIVTEDIKEGIKLVKDFYKEFSGYEEIENFIFVKENQEAVKHIYYVAAGFDSLVIGEDQILGQVKEALDFSMEIKASDKILNKLFREAITCSKLIKNKLKISENPLSISYIGIKYLKDIYKDLSEKRALIIGSGKMGMLALKYLTEENLKKVYITNRSHSKIINIDKEFEGISIVKYEERYEVLKNIDILITATSSPHTIIKGEQIKQIKNELTIIDFALPRDVDENVKNIDGIKLYDIDDLKKTSENNNKKRVELLKSASKIIEESISDFICWLQSVKVDPVIEALNNKRNKIESDTLEVINRKLNLDSKEKKVIEKMLNSAIKKIVRDPILKLKNLEGENEVNNYIDVVNELFNLGS